MRLFHVITMRLRRISFWEVLCLDCENEYCIYNMDNRCRFEKVTINSLGMCDDCVIISLDKDFLTKEKARQLQNIKELWKDADE